ncbi:MAG TPA: hypothetical protein PKY55_13135 [bacterium]|nr:hypothetical protein [bacterium]HPM60594.1 hypothetical protein [bacterium]
MNRENPPAFSYIPLASGISDLQVMTEIRNSFAAGLEAINGHELAPEQADRQIPLILLVLSGGTEARIAGLLAARDPEFAREPVLLIAHPGNNSLAASLEALAFIRQRHGKGEIIFFREGADSQARETLAERVQDLFAYRALQKSRIGLIGESSEWLVASTLDDTVFKTRWGVTIVHYALDEVFGGLAGAHPGAEVPAVSGFAAAAPAFHAAWRVHELLQRLAVDEELDGLSVECFTLFQRHNTHGCFALSRLNDQGIIAGCEGDLVSTTAMLWLKLLLGEAAWMANPVEIDAAGKELWLAHCTVPTSMVTGYAEATHFETGCGVAIAGVLANGPVTLVRIGGGHLDRFWVADAEIVNTGSSPHRCRTQALIRFKDHFLLNELLQRPLGNHLVLIRGHHAARLSGWWRMFIAS